MITTNLKNNPYLQLYVLEEALTEHPNNSDLIVKIAEIEAQIAKLEAQFKLKSK